MYSETPRSESTSPEHTEQPVKPRSRLRALLGRVGLFDASPQANPDSQPEYSPSAEYNRESLEEYLRHAGILGTDKDPSSTYMAAAIKTLPKLDVPRELSIVKVTPDNMQAADDFRLVAAISLNDEQYPAPYATAGIDEYDNNKTYYVGYVTETDKEPAAAVTLEVLNYDGKNEVARLNGVATLEAYRGHNYSGVMISNALSDSEYSVAFLDSTPAGKGLYEHLGFLTVG